MSMGADVEGYRFVSHDPPPTRVPSNYDAAILGMLDTQFLGPQQDVALSRFAVGSLHLIHCEAVPRRSARNAARISHDRFDGISVQLAVTGRSAGRGGGRSIVSVPDTVMILDFAQPFVMVDEERRVVVNLSIPRSAVMRWVRDPARLHGLVLSAPSINLLKALLIGICGDQSIVTSAQSERMERMLLDAVQVMLAHAGLLDDAGGAAPARNAKDRALALIATRLGSQDLSPEWLAERMGMSRRELYRLFHESGGVSRVILECRLNAARAALSDPADVRRIGEIAYAYGFASEAHFARSFRLRFAMTASAMRVRSVIPEIAHG